MCHPQYHLTPIPIRKPQQLTPHTLISPRLLPKRGRHNNRKLHLLPINPIHFLPNNPLNLPADSPQRPKLRINPIPHILHIPASHHQSMAVDHTVRRPLPKPFPHNFLHLHNTLPPFTFFYSIYLNLPTIQNPSHLQAKSIQYHL